MRTIVISGSSSNVGKTTLARELRDILPNSAVVKIGHGKRKNGVDNYFYPMDTSIDKIKGNHLSVKYLIIESNSILKDFTPDMVIFLKGTHEKSSSAYAKPKADMTSGGCVSSKKIASLGQRLNLDYKTVRQICWLAGARPEKASAIIMAGGKSIRMGTNKALLDVGGKTLIQHIYDSISTLFDEVLISVSRKNVKLIPEVRQVADLEGDRGPLMGLYSTLKKSCSGVNFVIACDIPFIEIQTLLELLSYSVHYDIVVPSFKSGRYEPLFAVYTKKVIPTAKQLLARNKQRISDLFPLHKTKILNLSEKSWYGNLNTLKDYNNYLRQIGKDQS